MIKRFPEAVIGLSDHYDGIAMGPVAYVLGARVFEKHFTLHHTWKGTDQAFSLEPIGMRKMVRDLKRVREALKFGKFPLECEKSGLYKMGKKLVAARPMTAGEVLAASDIRIVSPNDGLPPYELENILGCTLTIDMDEEETLSWECVE